MCVTKLLLTSECQSGDVPVRILVSGNTEMDIEKFFEAELRDVSSEHNSGKHKPKSRMREIRTSGSVRSAGLNPVFT